MRSVLGSVHSYQWFACTWFMVTLVAALVTLIRVDHIEDLLFHGAFNILLVLPPALVLATSSGLAARLLRIMGWLIAASAIEVVHSASNGASILLWGERTSDVRQPVAMLVVSLVLAVWGTFAVNRQTIALPKRRLWHANHRAERTAGGFDRVT